MANIDSVNLTRWADELLSALNLQFSSKKKKRSCLKELLAFMETNEFFGVQSEISSEGALFISRSDADRIRPNLELWLRSYGSDSDKKLKLLTERMVELFPDTGALFADFMASSPADSASAWKLADYLCFALCDEINQMSDKKLNSLAADMDRELPLTSARLFSEFLMYIRRRGWLHDGWDKEANWGIAFPARISLTGRTGGIFCFPMPMRGNGGLTTTVNI